MLEYFPTNLQSFLSIALILVSTAAAGCDDEPSPRETTTPLRPLVYTEHPELTPEGAAVREDRIMRELLEGAEEGGWGELGADETPPDLSTPKALGAAIFSALVDRDARRWDDLWVPPADYAALVHVDMETANEFVDEAQGESLPVWELFEPEPASASVEGGFRSVYELEGLRLGEGRAVDGKLVEDEGQPIAQHWGNTLVLKWRGTEQTFELRIPKILRVRRAGETTLRIASKISADRRMGVMHRAGMHLKPVLLRSAEYPYPLEVGNFWRYRRFRGELTEEPDPFEAGLRIETDTADAGGSTISATEVLDEVISIDRYGAWRLVQMRRSYNDANLTKETRWWLVLPRRIYLCVRACRTEIEDPSWLLTYIDQQTPVYLFPLRDGARWGVGGREDEPSFETAAIEPVETPAGIFDGVVRINGSGPLGTFDGRLDARQSRDVVWGEGTVRRILYDGREPLTEELVEHRVR